MNRYAISFVIGTALLAGQSVATAADDIKIGVPTALTGPYADLGNQVKRAVTFAMEEANAAGGIDGRKVDVRFLDTQGKADMARQQGEKLALSGYRLLLGSIGSGEGLAMAPMLERWNALYLSTINKANEMTGSSCVVRMFRANHPDNADATIVRPWLEGRKEQSWATVTVDTAWGRNSGEAFAEVAKSQNRKIVSQAHPALGTNDYAPYIHAIANSDAQGVWVALAGRDAVNFARQAKQFGLLDKVVAAGVSFVTDNTVQTLGDTAKGIYGIINYSSTLDTPENKTFVAAWEKKYPGTEPTNFEGETYLGMQVLFQSIAAAKSDKPADVARTMSGMTFQTIMGSAYMRPQDHQLVIPNYFGYVGDYKGKLKPIINMSLEAKLAMPAADGSCKLKEL